MIRGDVIPVNFVLHRLHFGGSEGEGANLEGEGDALNVVDVIPEVVRDALFCFFKDAVFPFFVATKDGAILFFEFPCFEESEVDEGGWDAHAGQFEGESEATGEFVVTRRRETNPLFGFPSFGGSEACEEVIPTFGGLIECCTEGGHILFILRGTRVAIDFAEMCF